MITLIANQISNKHTQSLTVYPFNSSKLVFTNGRIENQAIDNRDHQDYLFILLIGLILFKKTNFAIEFQNSHLLERQLSSNCAIHYLPIMHDDPDKYWYHSNVKSRSHIPGIFKATELNNN